MEPMNLRLQYLDLLAKALTDSCHEMTADSQARIAPTSGPRRLGLRIACRPGLVRLFSDEGMQASRG